MFRDRQVPIQSSNAFLDDSKPRPLPSYLRLPPPPPEANGVPSVPDVSLIFSPYSEKSNERLNPFTQVNPSSSVPAPAPYLQNKMPKIGIPCCSQHEFSHGLLVELINLVNQQSIQISRIEHNLQTLSQQNGNRKAYSQIGVQTDDPCILISQIQNKNRITNTQFPTKIRSQHGQGVAAAADDDVTQNNTVDLSNILNELQLPIITEQSLYSNHNGSIARIDIPEFNDYNDPPYKIKPNSPGIGPSVSDYSSSDDEEEVQPTVTYYRNVLGNVNRLLDNSAPPPQQPRQRNRNITNGVTQEDTAYGKRTNNNLMIQQNVYNSIYLPDGKFIGNNDGAAELQPMNCGPSENKAPQRNPMPTDTTMYGMSSSNLSFATREYLERHGLINAPPPQNTRPSNRILDSIIKHPPKLT